MKVVELSAESSHDESSTESESEESFIVMRGARAITNTLIAFIAIVFNPPPPPHSQTYTPTTHTCTHHTHTRECGAKSGGVW